jgi:TonB family protein
MSNSNSSLRCTLAAAVVMLFCVGFSFRAIDRTRSQGKAKRQNKGFICGGFPGIVNADSEMVVVDRREPDVVPGEPVKKVYPGYPGKAVAARVEGNVIVVAVVSKTGEVASIRFASGPALLIEESIESAKRWRFTPTSVNGEAQEVLARITFRYDLGLQKESDSNNEKKR